MTYRTADEFAAALIKRGMSEAVAQDTAQHGYLYAWLSRVLPGAPADVGLRLLASAGITIESVGTYWTATFAEQSPELRGLIEAWLAIECAGLLELLEEGRIRERTLQ